VHQEDAFRALAVPLPGKYESDDDGPTLRRVAALIRDIAADPARELDRLGEYVVFAVATGNADFHGRNVSLLYADDGPRLAPLYYTITTVVYDTVTSFLAMRVGGADSVDGLEVDDIVAELVGWGVPRARATRVVFAALERLRSALGPAMAAVPQAKNVATVVEARLAALLA
jgi:serine/threonine-protein kinase HipA